MEPPTPLYLAEMNGRHSDRDSSTNERVELLSHQLGDRRDQCGWIALMNTCREAKEIQIFR